MNRYAFLMKIKLGNENEYVKRHQQVWPSVKAACKRAGIQNYSIFMNGNNLFGYLECEDFDAVSKQLAIDPDVVKWEQYMASIMDVVRADQNGEGTHALLEVFHLD